MQQIEDIHARQRKYRGSRLERGETQVQIWLSKETRILLDELVTESGAANRSEVIQQLVEQQRKG